MSWVSESSAALGLAQPQRQPRALFLAGAGVDEPQQQRSRLLVPRRLPAANVEHPARSVRPDGARQAPRLCPRRLDGEAQRFEAFWSDPAIRLRKFRQASRGPFEPDLAEQLRVGFDPLVRANQQRPRRRKLQQPRVGARGVEHLLGEAEATCSGERDPRRDAEPQQRQRHDDPTARASSAHRLEATPWGNSYGEPAQKKGREANRPPALSRLETIILRAVAA